MSKEHVKTWYAKIEAEAEEIEIQSDEKIAEKSQEAVMSAIMENKTIDYQKFMIVVYLAFSFEDKKDRKK